MFQSERNAMLASGAASAAAAPAVDSSMPLSSASVEPQAARRMRAMRFMDGHTPCPPRKRKRSSENREGRLAGDVVDRRLLAARAEQRAMAREVDAPHRVIFPAVRVVEDDVVE